MRGLALIVLAGCLDNSNLPCGTTSPASQTVPGVSVALSTTACSFPTNTNTIFNYTITVDSAVTFNTGPHAACMPTTNDPRSFTTALVSGTGGQYCPTCDLGICGQAPDQSITLMPGPYAGTLNFPGRQWNGPSDTNVPIGGPLPAGNYTAKVKVELPAGTVEADLPITLL